MPARFTPRRSAHSLPRYWLIRLALIGILLTLTAAAPTPPPDPGAPIGTPAQQRAAHWMESIPVEQTLPETLRAEPPLNFAPGAPSTFNDWAVLAYQKANYYNYTWDIYFNPSVNTYNEEVLVSGDNSDEIFPRLSKDASRILYVSDRTGNLELYSTFTNGGATTQLTNHPAADSQPAWSPDDRTIAFVSNRDGNPELYRMNSDGTGLTRLTNSPEADLYPTWSPDGQSIAWIRSDDQGDSIWIMNQDGSAPRMIRSGLYYSGDLAWSPRGDRLAFDCDYNLDGWLELMVMDISGDNLKIVLSGSPDQHYDHWMGAWADDGQVIFGTRASWVQYGDRWYFYDAAIYEYNIDGMWGGDRIYYYTAAYPDVNLRDQTVPTSHIMPLPQFSKNTLLPLDFWLDDPGPAGLSYFTIEVSDGSDWKSIYSSEPTLESPFYYNASSPGSTLSFRSRARDWAGHVEPYPSSSLGDATTTIYRRSLTGSVLDNRGYPVVGSQPVASGSLVGSTYADAGGAYGLYLEDDQPFQANAVDARFGSLPEAAITGIEDSQHDFYLPPADNSFPGGTFDDPLVLLDGWEVSGDFPVEATAGHSGPGGVRLGLECADGCFLPKETSPAPVNYHRHMAAALDSLGNLHLLITGGQYFVRSKAGEWQQLASLPGSQDWTSIHSIYIDPSDTVHVFFLVTYDKLSYTRRALTGDWTAPEEVLINVNRQLRTSLGLDGNLYVADICDYDCSTQQSGVYIWKRSASGWETPWLMAQSTYATACQISNPVALPDGSVYLIAKRYEDSYPRLLSHSAGGKQTARDLIPFHDVHYYELFAQPDGGMQAIYRMMYSMFVSEGQADGPWLAPMHLGWGNSVANITVTPDGTIYYLYDAGDPSELVLVRKNRAEREVTNQVFFSTGSLYESLFLIDKDGRQFFVQKEDPLATVRATRLDGQAGSAALSRTITIPADAHNPTLSFVYRVVSPQLVRGALFRVSASDGETTAAWETSERTDDWQSAYLDVTQFAGREVQVTFTYQQQPGDAPAHVELDEISLGSWTTPVIAEVTPGWLGQYPSDRLITIHGQNFMDGARVRVGTLTLEASLVTWVNDATLEVTLPDSLPLGIHDVWVTNPDGMQAVVEKALTLGQWLYLPFTVSR